MEIVSVIDIINGSKPFIDRPYTFSTAGNYRKSCMFIRGANDDKDTNANSVQTTINVRSPCTVYLDFWGGSSHLAKVSSWIGDWNESANAKATVFDQYGPGIVMKRDFQDAKINLMGNNGHGNGTYYAFVCPQGQFVNSAKSI